MGWSHFTWLGAKLFRVNWLHHNILILKVKFWIMGYFMSGLSLVEHVLVSSFWLLRSQKYSLGPHTPQAYPSGKQLWLWGNMWKHRYLASMYSMLWILSPGTQEYFTWLIPGIHRVHGYLNECISVKDGLLWIMEVSTIFGSADCGEVTLRSFVGYITLYDFNLFLHLVQCPFTST